MLSLIVFLLLFSLPTHTQQAMAFEGPGLSMNGLIERGDYGQTPVNAIIIISIVPLKLNSAREKAAVQTN
jgi:hypothetical protein